MIGDSSTYPQTIDDLYQVYNENYTGYSISEELHTIPNDGTYQVALKHWAKTDTFTIPGYSRTTGTPGSGQFQEISFAVPTYTQTEIDYAVGKILQFYSGDAGNKVKISYTSPGNKMTAELYNLLADAVYKIETYLGTMGADKDIQLGGYASLCQKIARIEQLLYTHTHTGGSGSEATNQLTTNSFSTFQVLNSHVSSSADIAQTKLNMGIKDSNTSAIPSGTNFYIDITSANYSHTNGDRVRVFRGVKGETDSGEIGNLAHDTANSEDGTFRIIFYTDEATITTGIPFFWEIYNASS